MALAINKVYDATAALGIAMYLKNFLFAPGTSDYVTGGYPISAGACELSELWGISLIGVNAAGTAYFADIVQPAPSGNAQASPSATVYLKVSTITAGAKAEVANGTNLTGIIWTGAVYGY